MGFYSRPWGGSTEKYHSPLGSFFNITLWDTSDISRPSSPSVLSSVPLYLKLRVHQRSYPTGLKRATGSFSPIQNFWALDGGNLLLPWLIYLTPKFRLFHGPTQSVLSESARRRTRLDLNYHYTSAALNPTKQCKRTYGGHQEEAGYGFPPIDAIIQQQLANNKLMELDTDISFS